MPSDDPRQAGAGPKRILICGHSRLGSALTVGSHQLYWAYAKRSDCDPVHLSLPVSCAHLLRLDSSEIRRRFRAAFRAVFEPGPRNIVPFQICGPQVAFGQHDLSPMHRFVTRPRLIGEAARAIREQPTDVLIVDHPYWSGIEDVVRPRKLIYRATDIYSAFIGRRQLVDLERRYLRCSDVVIATSKPVAEHLSAGGAPRVQVIENGVDFEHWSELRDMPAAFADIPEPRAIYIGALDFRFGFDILLRCAERLPQVNFVVVGPLGRLPRKLQRPNVHLIGAVPYADAPAYAQWSQVGLLPLAANRANEGRSPMKLYEYAAAGLPVVSSPSAELCRRDLPFVTFANDVEFSTAVARSIMRRGAVRTSAQTTAARFGWNAIADRVLAHALGAQAR